MPASPMDVEAQVPGTSGGNRWLVETMYFVLRILELVSILALRFTSYYPLFFDYLIKNTVVNSHSHSLTHTCHKYTHSLFLHHRACFLLFLGFLVLVLCCYYQCYW